MPELRRVAVVAGHAIIKLTMAEYGEPLTEREIELLRMVATGVTNREIAYRLCISVNTVKVHLRNIFVKLGAESRTEATMIAVREGWVVIDKPPEQEEVRAKTGNEAAAVPLPQPQPVIPEPALPWFKRLALIVTFLLVIAGVLVSWARDNTRAGDNGHGLPLALPSERSLPPVSGAQTSPWRELAQMPTRRAYLALAAWQGRIFAIAGQTAEGPSAVVEIYSTEKDLWVRGLDKPTPVAYVSAAVIGKEAYVPGGCDAFGRPLATLEIYDMEEDTWREGSPLPEARCAYALAAWNDRLFLFGGWDGTKYVSTVFVYDTQTDSWSQGQPMDGARGLAAAAPSGDRIYVVGGYDGRQELTTCAFYDPVIGNWGKCAPLTIGRGGLGLVSVSGQLYAIGGGGWTSYLGFSERYDPNSDRWTTFETPLIGQWRSPGVTSLGTSVYAIGGWNDDYLSTNQSYTSFQLFIPVVQ